MVIHDTQSLGQYLAYRRKQVGLTQQDLATRLGATQAWVSSLERGKPGAGVGQVLRVIAELSLQFSVSATGVSATQADDAGGLVGFDLNAYVDSQRFVDDQ